jgi:hypothetical protein
MAQDPSLRRMDSPPVDQQNRKKATVFAQSRAEVFKSYRLIGCRISAAV